jgi:hypothetical protein
LIERAWNVFNSTLDIEKWRGQPYQPRREKMLPEKKDTLLITVEQEPTYIEIFSTLGVTFLRSYGHPAVHGDARSQRRIEAKLWTFATCPIGQGVRMNLWGFIGTEVRSTVCNIIDGCNDPVATRKVQWLSCKPSADAMERKQEKQRKANQTIGIRRR